jgi:hypothetical protein
MTQIEEAATGQVREVKIKEKVGRILSGDHRFQMIVLRRLLFGVVQNSAAPASRRLQIL